jgi:hypothetical protein
MNKNLKYPNLQYNLYLKNIKTKTMYQLKSMKKQLTLKINNEKTKKSKIEHKKLIVLTI